MISYEYLAGVVDGEGCITFGGNPNGSNTSLWLVVVNTNRMLLEKLQECFGGRIYVVKKVKANCKVVYRWHFVAQEAIDLLIHIKPFIIAKEAQIDLALEFWQFHSNKLNRYNVVLTPTSFSANQKSRKVKPEVLIKELEFRRRMNVLNKKGGT